MCVWEQICFLFFLPLTTQNENYKIRFSGWIQAWLGLAWLNSCFIKCQGFHFTLTNHLYSINDPGDKEHIDILLHDKENILASEKP